MISWNILSGLCVTSSGPMGIYTSWEVFQMVCYKSCVYTKRCYLMVMSSYVPDGKTHCHFDEVRRLMSTSCSNVVFIWFQAPVYQVFLVRGS